MTLATIMLGSALCAWTTPTDVNFHTLENGRLKMKVADVGGRIMELWAPDKDGNLADVAVAFENPNDYNTTDYYLGPIIGRYCNRIAGGRFTLDGKVYQCTQNDPQAAGEAGLLHGGRPGWDARRWKVTECKVDGNPALKLELESPDGDQGFPGNVKATVHYILLQNDTLRITYDAVTDKPTPISMTSHLYLNLTGDTEQTILGHVLQMAAKRFTPLSPVCGATGEILPVEGTALDFTAPHVIGERIDCSSEQMVRGRGYDHNWVLDAGLTDTLHYAARLSEPTSGRAVEIWTTEPGLQFYTGNFFKDTWRGKRGKGLRYRGALALETQHFPDSPNHLDFPSTIVRPGEKYHSETEYRFL